MFLVDTNVVSVVGPTDRSSSPALAEWLDRNATRLFISTVTVAEIESGIARLRRTDATRKAERLASWLNSLLVLYGSRVLPLDLAAGRLLGSFSDVVRASGRSPGFFDLAIAAIASSRGLMVLTRNPRHFQSIPVASHDPFASLPTP